MIDKQEIISAICAQLEADLIALKAATLATYDAATNEESKPENEYDTRALEASYLAGAQAKRLAEVEELIYLFKNAPIRKFSSNDAISSTALVEVELNGRRSFVFLMSKGGGLRLSVQGITVQTLSPASPLGEALLGLHVGDSANVEYKNETQEYHILQIL
jgi:hypothetical protein